MNEMGHVDYSVFKMNTNLEEKNLTPAEKKTEKKPLNYP